MKGDAPAGLAEFQARFGAVIRTPLDRSTGTLTAQTSSYDPQLVADVSGTPTLSGSDRLAVYNRQLWFRLFDVLQNAFPLTAQLLGYWTFNDYAARFFLANPPQGWDIDHVPDGFASFFAGVFESNDVDERQVLLESARIDAAWREVFRAPQTTPFRPSAAEAARLLDARLTPSPALALVEEHYPLLELRKEILRATSETRRATPPALAHARSWALVRTDQGILQLPLERREGELLTLLRAVPVREALARLERACTEDERKLLPAKTQTWLARSVEREFWVGLED